MYICHTNYDANKTYKLCKFQFTVITSSERSKCFLRFEKKNHMHVTF